MSRFEDPSADSVIRQLGHHDFLGTKKRSKEKNQTMGPIYRIHGTGIFTYIKTVEANQM